VVIEYRQINTHCYVSILSFKLKLVHVTPMANISNNNTCILAHIELIIAFFK